VVAADVWRNGSVVHIPEDATLYYLLIAKHLFGMAPAMQLAITTLVFLVCGISLFRLAKSVGMIKRSDHPIVVFLVMISLVAIPGNFSIHPPSLALMFLLPAISQIIKSGTAKAPVQMVFNAGFLASVATLLAFPLVVFLPFFFIALMAFRLYKWNYFMVLLSGQLLPWIYAAVAGWITGQWPLAEWHSMLGIWISGFLYFPEYVSSIFVLWDYLLIGISFVFITVAFTSVYSRMGQRLIHVRYTFSALLWLSVPVIPLLVISGAMVLQYILIFGFFLTIVGSNFLSTIKRSARIEVLLWLILTVFIIGYLVRL
jgi:hypothetical protein